MIEIVWMFLAAIIRFLALEPIWCDAAAAASGRHRESPLPFVSDEPVIEATVAGEDVIVVSGASASRRLLRSSPVHGTRELMPRTQILALGGEYLSTRGDRWWYAVSGSRDGVKGTCFVSDDGTATMVPAGARLMTQWLPLKGDRPRALELSVGDGGVPLATEIAASGPVRSWYLPMPPGRHSSAELLPDGRIAVVAHDRGSGRLTLLLLADGDQIEILALGFKTLLNLATAVDASGRLAIVTATTDRRVAGTVIDPLRAGDPQWRQLRRDIRLQAWKGDLQAIAVSGGFVAAWINRSAAPPRLEVANVSLSYADGPFVTVGELSDRGRDTFFSLREDEGELRLTWDDSTRLVTRRLPASLSGHHLIEWMSAECCER